MISSRLTLLKFKANGRCEGYRLSELLTPLMYQLGVGVIGGLIVGFAIKKALKLLAVLIGFFILVLIYLGYSGIITVNYDRFADAILKVFGLSKEAAGVLAPILASLPFAASFFVGLAIGFKLG